MKLPHRADRYSALPGFLTSMAEYVFRTQLVWIILTLYLTPAVQGYCPHASPLVVKVNTTEGVIQAPTLADGLYAPNSHCVWHLQAPPNMIIQLHFHKLDTQCPRNNVTIYNGQNTKDDVFENVCGTLEPLPLATTTNYGLLEFRTDSSLDRYTGFALAVKATSHVPIEFRAACNHNTRPAIVETPMSLLLSKQYGIFPHPKLSYLCKWQIQAPAGQLIKMKLLNFQLDDSGPQCEDEYLKIVDGACASSEVIQRRCGTQTDQSAWYSGKRTLCLEYSSTNSISRGFQFLLEFVNISELACSNNPPSFKLTEPTRVSPSPWQPNGPTSKKCHWTIQAPIGKVINFQSEKLEFPGECDQKRGIFIYDANFANPSYLVKKLCQPSDKQNTSSSHVNMHVVFRGVRTNDFGDTFRGSFEFKEIDSRACGSQPLRLTSPEGGFSSPRYGGTYPPNSHCTYSMEAPHRQTVRLEFLNFHMKDYSSRGLCMYENITVYDDGLPLPTRGLGIFCGPYAPTPVGVTQNKMFLEFKGNKVPPVFSGFRARYRFIDTAAIGCGVDESASHLPAVIDWGPGELLSPLNWGGLSACRYNISAPSGMVVRLDVSGYNMESCHGRCCRLEVYEGTNRLYSRCRTYVEPPGHGPIITPTVESIRVTILGSPFLSQANGDFTLMYTFEEKAKYACDANHRPFVVKPGAAQTGTITTAQFGRGHYPRNQNCLWIINANPGEIIEIWFRHFDILDCDDKCLCSHVTLYNGNTTSATRMSTMCGSGNYRLYSNINALTVEFISPDDRSAQGFFAIYTIVHNTERACVGGAALRMNYSPGRIMSPPESLLDKVRNTCAWTITATFGQHVEAWFSVLDLGHGIRCGSDPTFTFRDGGNPIARVMFRFCGGNHNVNKLSRIRSTLHQLYIEFESSGIQRYNYDLHYKFTVPDTSIQTGAIIGIVMGVILCLVLIICIIIVSVIKYRQIQHVQRRPPPRRSNAIRQPRPSNRQSRHTPTIGGMSSLDLPSIPIQLKPPEYTAAPPPSYEEATSTA